MNNVARKCKNYMFFFQVWDKDLNLMSELVAGESWLYAIAVSDTGKVYVGSNDGSLRIVADPLKDKESKKVLECREEILSVCCDKNKVYCGDDKGVVSAFEDDKFISRIETSESCNGLKVEDNFIFTIRDKDLSVNTMTTTKLLASLTNRTVIPGRAPIDLFGPVVNGHHSYIVLPYRGGKGFVVLYNSIEKKFGNCAETGEDAHEMLINAIAGIDDVVFSADYQGKVKRWVLHAEAKKLTLSSELDVCPGVCINAIVATDTKTVYVGASDGLLRKVEYA